MKTIQSLLVALSLVLPAVAQFRPPPSGGGSSSTTSTNLGGNALVQVTNIVNSKAPYLRMADFTAMTNTAPGAPFYSADGQYWLPFGGPTNQNFAAISNGVWRFDTLRGGGSDAVHLYATNDGGVVDFIMSEFSWKPTSFAPNGSFTFPTHIVSSNNLTLDGTNLNFSGGFHFGINNAGQGTAQLVTNAALSGPTMPTLSIYNQLPVGENVRHVYGYLFLGSNTMLYFFDDSSEIITNSNIENMRPKAGQLASIDFEQIGSTNASVYLDFHKIMFGNRAAFELLAANGLPFNQPAKVLNVISNNYVKFGDRMSASGTGTNVASEYDFYTGLNRSNIFSLRGDKYIINRWVPDSLGLNVDDQNDHYAIWGPRDPALAFNNLLALHTSTAASSCLIRYSKAATAFWSIGMGYNRTAWSLYDESNGQYPIEVWSQVGITNNLPVTLTSSLRVNGTATDSNGNPYSTNNASMFQATNSNLTAWQALSPTTLNAGSNAIPIQSGSGNLNNFTSQVARASAPGLTNFPWAVVGSNGLNMAWVSTNTANGSVLLAVGTNWSTATIISNWNGMTYIIPSNSAPAITINGGNGGVGIGTNAPQQKLHVAGQIHNDGVGSTSGGDISPFAFGWLIQAVAGAQLQIKNSDSTHFITLANSAGGNQAQVLDAAFYVANNLGIGTTAPSYKLHVVGDAYVPTNAAPFTVTTPAATTLVTNLNQRGTLVLKLAFDDVTGGIPSCTIVSTNLLSTNSFGVLSPTLSGLTLVGTVTITNDYSYPLQTNCVLKITDTSSGGAAVRVVQTMVFEQ